MRKLCTFAACAVLSAPAAAVNTENYRIPYLAASTNYVITDSVRESENGYGYQVSIGVPGKDETRAYEITFFDHAYKREDRRKNYQTGILVDYVRNLSVGGVDRERGFLSKAMPYWLAGAGFIEEDVFGVKHLHPTLEAGVGTLLPFGGRGWALRLDARGAFQFNKETPEAVGSDKGSVLDFRLMVGVQLPLTVFFDRDLPVPEQKDCEVAVVDPETGRRDCVADSDRDGVADTLDRCPATPPATAVDAGGCAVSEGPADSDGDAVLDESDRCPATREGLTVNGSGCAVSQTFNLYEAAFAADSAELSEEGKGILSGIAATLMQQPALKIEIAGHTDAIGSEAYNLLLSQQRAEAVATYLVNQGVARERLSANGYGEAQPLASNETEEGRAQNRRIELRLQAD